LGTLEFNWGISCGIKFPFEWGFQGKGFYKKRALWHDLKNDKKLNEKQVKQLLVEWEGFHETGRQIS